MDFTKFKYDEEKKERQNKKRHHQTHLKEIRVKPNIEEHDYQVKLKQLIAFLREKDKVKVGLFFRAGDGASGIRPADYGQVGYRNFPIRHGRKAANFRGKVDHDDYRAEVSILHPMKNPKP